MKILIAVGGSGYSQLGVHQVVRLAEKESVSGTILTVIKDKEEEAAATLLLQEAADILQTAVSPCTPKSASVTPVNKSWQKRWPAIMTC
ncbi:MAG: hypothetical protein M5U34_17165 [Chloroflexi bacterium]|nr:hypothetical protein [Chloroflexota bacterium]